MTQLASASCIRAYSLPKKNNLKYNVTYSNTIYMGVDSNPSWGYPLVYFFFFQI